MGNWRTVNIIGKVDANEVEALKEACTVDSDYNNFHCLSICNGLCGLGDWVQTNINARGNLAERDYTVEDVAEEFKKLVKIAPSLEVKIHCGGNNEDEKCIATITVKNREVKVHQPESELISGASKDEMQGRLLKQVIRKPISKEISKEKLKTLKDFPPDIIKNKKFLVNIETKYKDEAEKIINIAKEHTLMGYNKSLKDLRQAIINWVKALEKKETNRFCLSCLGYGCMAIGPPIDHTELWIYNYNNSTEVEGAIKILKFIFNITNEDLK